MNKASTYVMTVTLAFFSFLFIYAGSYLTLSIPQPHPTGPAQRAQCFRANYKLLHDFYSPLTRLDKQLRKQYWGSPQDASE